MQAAQLPNLEIGVETPWPLKREGKQVYARLIDFGGLPLQMRAKTHNVPDIEWSQVSWDHSYVASSTDGRRRSLALVSTPDTSPSAMPWRFLVDSTSVQVNMQILKDYTAWDTVVLCLLYTKTGEGAESGSLIVPGPEGTVLTSRDNELVWEEGGSGCDCEIATPMQQGLVPEGGRAGEVYQVAADGRSYEWADVQQMGSFPGQLIASFTSAGRNEFTVPDPFGDGSAFNAEIWLKGAGGGGGRAKGMNNGWCCSGQGGGEGELVIFKKRLTPGQIILVETGRGGAPGAVSNAGSSGPAAEDGGDSIFGGEVTASGGRMGAHPHSGYNGGSYNSKGEFLFSNDLIRVKGATGNPGMIMVHSSTSSAYCMGALGAGRYGGMRERFTLEGIPGQYGCGGGGGYTYLNTAYQGTRGGDGFCMVWAQGRSRAVR